MTTEILFVLDRSTSMGHIAEQAVEGFNAFLKQQKESPKGKRLTLLQFDDKLEYTYVSKKVKNCKPLVCGETYQIQGCTALLDAIGSGLSSLKNAKKVIVAIYTDGEENSSREFGALQVKKALKKATKKGWETIFLAADVSTKYATQTLGFAGHKVALVSKGDFLSNMNTISARTVMYASSGLQNDDSLQDDIDKDLEATG